MEAHETPNHTVNGLRTVIYFERPSDLTHNVVEARTKPPARHNRRDHAGGVVVEVRAGAGAHVRSD